VLAKTQLYLPTDGTPLWNFFRTGENMVVNKGALAQKDVVITKGRNERQVAKGVKTRKDGKSSKTNKVDSPIPDPPTEPPASPPPPTPTAAMPTVEEAMGDAFETPAGLVRGGKGGRGRGGGVQLSTKVAIRDLIVEDSIPGPETCPRRWWTCLCS
jgi:hypothetical protein